MKKFTLLLVTLIYVFLLPSCDDNDIEKRQAVFIATVPAEDLSSSRLGSVINGVPAADGFNLNARWKEGDKIQIFVRQDGRVYQAESPSTVFDISSDGKTCSFMVTLPKSVKRDRDYDIIGVTGVEAYIDGNDVIATCALTRVGIDDSGSVSLPMWFTAKKGSNQAKFSHLCVYEVLTVNNNSESSITFRHQGFDVTNPWYKYSDKIVLTNSSRKIVSQDSQTDAESNEITIAPGATGTIVSWYIPAYDIIDATTGVSNAAIDNARLKAVINNDAVSTDDVLKSHKIFARGNAYYMDVNWDGSSLFYSNAFCPDGNHPHIIDMGFPSGTKWACCNVMANSPAESGYYFAWGETKRKTSYDWDNYKWCKRSGDNIVITKYHYNVDGKSRLDPEDDAATANWGAAWRMPTYLQLKELLDNSDSDWTNVNGVWGRVFKSKTNGESVFFPATGYRYESTIYNFGTSAEYWSCVTYYTTTYGIGLYIEGGDVGNCSIGGKQRCAGHVVRAVHVAQE